MTTGDIILHIFCLVDDHLPALLRHSQAKLYPSELVTIGILFALKGGFFRAFYRWLKRDFGDWFGDGALPERTRLQRLLKAHQDWCQLLLVDPTFFTVMDSYPIELIFPIRQGRSPHQVGKKGYDKGRWSVGIKFCWLLNDFGQVVAWDWSTMNVKDNHFNSLVKPFIGKTIVLADYGFREKGGVPENMKVCQKGTWNERMYVETALSLVTVICDLKRIRHRITLYIQMRLAFVSAMFNILKDLYYSLHPDCDPYKMSIAEFSL
ncbi:MAG: transposase [Chloroflexota bacterium]